ncbi:MAG: M14 family murein peptide amidase A [Proteobacteria bacterium]|nr:M14 family murein peptide amidase A [Pseudomonadota bacterium]
MIKIIKVFILVLLFLNTPVLAEDDWYLVEQECERIGSKLGSVSIQDCLDINLSASDGRSVKDAPILIKEYPPLARRSPLGKVLLIGGIHGDEYSSVSIVFKWMRTLDIHHSGLFHWHIVPLLNPDGLLRKKSQRMNENNVDLNRNFPIEDWENTAKKHWIEITGKNPRRYPGESALSEPETAWLVEHINNFQPDVIVAVHAPHGIVDYDGPRNGPYKLGRLYLNLLGTYPGSLGNYAGIQREIPVVTIELPYAGIMPTHKEINSIWRDMVRWLSKNITEEAYLESLKESQDTTPS